jgi:hypothetical protein
MKQTSGRSSHRSCACCGQKVIGSSNKNGTIGIQFMNMEGHTPDCHDGENNEAVKNTNKKHH